MLLHFGDQVWGTGGMQPSHKVYHSGARDPVSTNWKGAEKGPPNTGLMRSSWGLERVELVNLLLACSYPGLPFTAKMPMLQSRQDWLHPNLQEVRHRHQPSKKVQVHSRGWQTLTEVLKTIYPGWNKLCSVWILLLRIGLCRLCDVQREGEIRNGEDASVPWDVGQGEQQGSFWQAVPDK